MNEFLTSIKADLLDRRLLPIVALVVLALVGAIAYAVFGGGSSATPTAAVRTAPVTVSAGLAVTQTSPEKAVAETTGGVTDQRHGTARNPFTPLPEPKAKQAAASSTSTSSTSSSTTSSSSSGSGSESSSGGSSPTTPPKSTKPAKPRTVYQVSVLFGEVPAGFTPAQTHLNAFNDLKLLTPLPSAQQPLIIFRGVTAGGKSATFTIAGEEILHGEAMCLPSASQCEAIDLKAGQTEQLEYISPAGQTVVEELRIVSIVTDKATSAAFKSVLRGESKVGRKLLEHAGLIAIPDLRYSAQAGVLVFAGHSAFAARARAAARARQHRRR